MFSSTATRYGQERGRERERGGERERERDTHTHIPVITEWINAAEPFQTDPANRRSITVAQKIKPLSD